jgi:hypothetical protein
VRYASGTWVTWVTPSSFQVPYPIFSRYRGLCGAVPASYLHVHRSPGGVQCDLALTEFPCKPTTPLERPLEVRLAIKGLFLAPFLIISDPQVFTSTRKQGGWQRALVLLSALKISYHPYNEISSDKDDQDKKTVFMVRPLLSSSLTTVIHGKLGMGSVRA